MPAGWATRYPPLTQLALSAGDRDTSGSATRDQKTPPRSALYAQESAYKSTLQNGVLKKYSRVTRRASVAKVLNFDLCESSPPSADDPTTFQPTISLKNKTSAKFLSDSITQLQSKISSQKAKQHDEESIFLIEPEKPRNIELDLRFSAKDEPDGRETGEADGQKTPSFF